MLTIIEAALTRTRSVLMVFVLLLISGAITYANIAKEANPDITIPNIYVSMVHDGISPEDAERMLVRPMEKELKSIAGIKEITSTASEGHASINIEFLAGLDPKDALADVRDKVTLAKAKLPSESEEPEVHEVTMANQVPAVPGQILLSEVTFSKVKDWVKPIGQIRVKVKGVRRKRDSNPRRCDPQQFSRLPHSTTLPFLLECLIRYSLNAAANILSPISMRFYFIELLLPNLPRHIIIRISTLKIKRDIIRVIKEWCSA